MIRRWFRRARRPTPVEVTVVDNEGAEQTRFTIPENGIYQINGGYRAVGPGQPMELEWVELLKAKGWDDPDLELIDLHILDRRHP